MDSYKKIAARYMKKSLGRSVFSIIGVAFLAMLIYGFFSVVLCSRESSYLSERKMADYEMCFVVNDSETAKRIVNEDFIRTAKIGERYNENTDKAEKNTLFINIKNPYRIDSKFKYITSTYGVQGEINEGVANYYFQGEYGSEEIVTIFIACMFSMIFAVFGIGIIRNSLFLFLSEYIRDFGMIRCIGGTKKQVRKIFTRICGYIEIIGILLGIIMCIPVQMLITKLMLGKVKIYFSPLFVIVIAFMFDLFFLVRDITKKLNKMSPIMAVHSNMNSFVKNGKLKARGKGFLFRIFGIEGTYAYKNIMRKPGRFVANIIMFTFGIALIVTFGSITSSISGSMEERFKNCGEYQMVISVPQFISTEPMIGMPTKEELKEITELDWVKSVKKEYSIMTYVPSIDVIEDNYTTTYARKYNYTSIKKYKQDDEKYFLSCMAEVFGYDQEDMKGLEKYVVEGSLDIKEDEIILVDYDYVMNEDDTLMGYSLAYPKRFEYKVGDTIDLLDYIRLREEYKKLEPLTDEDKWVKSMTDRRINELHKDFVDKGFKKTFKIKAIVRPYDCSESLARIKFIMPLENLYSYSGLTESGFTGFKYKIDRDKLSTLNMDFLDNYSEYMSAKMLYYLEATTYRIALRVAFVLLGCIFLIMLCNYINNVSANINMRRKEFAQLRVVGLSKIRLLKIVLIEGFVTTFVASVIGILVGIYFSHDIYSLFMPILSINYKAPVGICIVASVSMILTVGITSTIILNRMKVNMAEDLKEEGF